MSLDAVVPAHNEEQTVGPVVRVLRASGVFGRVLVVDDGCSDATAQVAKTAGAAVLRLSPNRGKAEAMLAGIAELNGDVAFFDADLLGLHVGLANILQVLTPVMTGERIVRRWVLDQVPASCWRGYAIETVINFLVDSRSGSTCLVPMRGVTVVNKTEKFGMLRGWIGHFRMARQMRDAAQSLARSGGVACQIR